MYTVYTGKFVGKDQFGNKFYSSKKGKRWVIYKDKIESTKITPEWHLWIHFLTNNIPDLKINKTHHNFPPYIIFLFKFKNPHN